MTEKIVYALDYETHYTKDYSLKVLPTRAYVYHDEFHAYMLAVAGSDGYVWVGDPKDFDWSRIEGQIVLHHNAQFDALVTQRLVELGIIPDVKPAAIHDTADLAAYLQHPRALKDHAKFVWGLTDIAEKGKKARDRMATMASDELASDPEILEYATMDSKLSLRLWQEFEAEWPTEERELSRLNREACFRGIAIDTQYVEDACNRMAHKLFYAERSIPWDWSGKKTPLSRNKIIEHCNKVGIWYPASFAQGDEDCLRWEDEFADKHPWVKAIRDWRRINMLYAKIKHLSDNTFGGLYYPQFKYFGARTGRFSGDGKFNLQNLPRDEMFCDTDENGKDIPGTGCDLRRCFIARPGHKLAMIDYAQIEARALVAAVEDEKVLPDLRAGMSIYEAHARATMGWTGGELKKENKDLYQLAKARVLGLGYGCGPNKFVLVAKLLAGVDVTIEEAKKIVDDFRRSNPGIVALWEKLDQKIRVHGATEENVCTWYLHSGRPLNYWQPRFRVPANNQSPQLMSMFARGDKSSYRKTYGGLLTENLIQALCRDVLRDAWINLDKHGYRVLWSVHDELIVELPEDADVGEAERIMLDAPEWAKFIPLAVESQVGKHYMK
jgi:DNA polymerase I-like protein with 3'-5' exonuclease and polymerase domains